MNSAPPPPSRPGDYIPGQTPGVIIWYKVYLIFMVLMFLVLAGLGAAFYSGLIPVTADDLDGLPPKVLGIIYLVLGVALAVPYLVALFLPRKNWVWVYHMVMICIGMTGCTLAASIPLLIFWLKPDVKGYFNENS